MAIDPQAAVPISILSVLIVALGQLVTYFTKQSKEPENGSKNQIKTNTEDIKALENDMRNLAKIESVRSLELDMRDVVRRLGTMEEQVKTNVVEMLTIRPKIHELVNNVQHLLFVEKEQREKERDRERDKGRP